MLPATSAIVRNEKSKITIVVQKRGEIEDCGSLDGLSRSLSYEHGVREIVNPDMSKTVTREVWHEDGSRTTIVEDFDEGGSKINKKTRTYKMGSDGSINVSTDEQAGRPSRLFSNGPLNVFGDMSMTVLKKSRSQKVGISLMTRETPNGNVLFVSHIDPVGLFAKTPLRVGDTILSVNEFNFRNNPDAKLAFCVIQGVSGDLTIVARKSEQRGEEFLLKRAKKKRDEHRRTVQTIHIPAPKLNEREFDEESYGACMDGYNSSRIFAVTKMNPNEDFGIKMVSEGTAWGTLLLISEISPSRRLSATDLKIGDAVLAINGVCFRDDPDENRAAAVLRDSRKHIVIEYQPLSIMKPALRPAEPVQPRVTQIVKPDGVRCVRTETINPDGSTTVKVEEFAPIPDHVPIERTDSDISGLGSVVSGMSTWVDPRERSVKIFEKSDSDSAKSIFVPEVVPLNSDVVRVTVTKRNPKEEVGISVHTLNGALYVSKVSPTGLLVGKPILPGDIILSINNENFRKNPNAKDAFSLILHARDSVTFEVLKMSNNTIGRGIDGGRKLGFCKRLMCSQRVSQQKQSNSYFDPFYV